MEWNGNGNRDNFKNENNIIIIINKSLPTPYVL